MIYKINDFRHRKPDVKIHVERNPNVPLNHIVSEIAVFTGVPVIVICVLLKELGYENIKLDETLNFLIKFYKAEVIYD